MHATRQAGIEAAHRAHNVDALEVLRAVFLEDGRVLYGILVGARSAIDIAHAAIPWRRRIGMVVGDLAILDDHVMREDAAYRLMESATNGLLWYGEVGPGFGMPGAYLIKRLIDAVQSDGSGIGLEVGACPVA